MKRLWIALMTLATLLSMAATSFAAQEQRKNEMPNIREGNYLPYGLAKFKRYALNVWDVDPAGKSDEQVAHEGLDRMAGFMKEIGVILNSAELGVTDEMLEGIARNTLILTGGYKVLTAEDVIQIVRTSMKE